jgi:hypothetical protein
LPPHRVFRRGLRQAVGLLRLGCIPRFGPQEFHALYLIGFASSFNNARTHSTRKHHKGRILPPTSVPFLPANAPIQMQASSRTGETSMDRVSKFIFATILTAKRMAPKLLIYRAAETGPASYRSKAFLSGIACNTAQVRSGRNSCGVQTSLKTRLYGNNSCSSPR